MVCQEELLQIKMAYLPWMGQYAII